MKKQASTIAIAVAALLIIGFFVVMYKTFMKDPEPTVKDIPDYGKMTNEEIMKAKQNDLKMEGQKQPDPGASTQ